MPTLDELIRQYPGIGEWMADMENRLSYLENSMPVKNSEGQVAIPETEPAEWSKEQWVAVNHLRAMLNNVQSKLIEYRRELLGHIGKDKPSSKRKSKGIEL